MPFFAVVNSTTGAISQNGYCAKSADMALQAVAGCQVEEVPAELAGVVNGKNYKFNLATSAFELIVSLLDQAKSAKSTALSSSCSMAIYAGFHSSATGTDYFYPSSAIDQVNLQAAASTGGLLATQDGAGTWGLTSHTAAEAIGVLGDFGTMRDAARTKLAGLNVTVAACTTVDQVNAVTW